MANKILMGKADSTQLLDSLDTDDGVAVDESVGSTTSYNTADEEDTSATFDYTEDDDNLADEMGDETPALAATKSNDLATTDVLAEKSTELGYLELDLKPEPIVGDASNAHDLSAVQWQEVLRTNSLLYGFQIREANQDVVRARYNAFVLRKVIPYFQVEDGSSIQVQETKSDFQRSLAHNSFSKRCIESSLSAGDFGIAAGISGSRQKEKKQDHKDQRTLRNQEYYAVYNFPRARLLLDEEELELSSKCKEMLVNIKERPTFDRLQRFYKLFGHVFVTSVLLGGQQKTSKFAAALSTLDEDVQQDALRSAIGAKINAQYISSSIQISREKSKGNSQADQQYTSLSSLGISSSGGDTLIGSDISQWVRTVAPSKNWRVIENEIAESIPELIGKFPEWDHVPALFHRISESHLSTYRPWTGNISFTMFGRPLCWDTSGGPLRLCCPDKSSANLKKAIFRVIPAVRGADTESLLPLSSDWPYFLQAGELGLKYWRPLGVKTDHQGAAYFVTESSPNISYCRFSFRAIDRSGSWKPNLADRDALIADGEQVHLYCHSLGLGPYASLQRPPSIASPARYYTRSDLGCDIYFMVHPEHRAPANRELVKSYDGSGLTPVEQEAFEKMGMISAKEYAPGPITTTVLKTETVSIGIGGIAEKSHGKKRSIDYSVINGKKVRLDWKKLQQTQYKSLDLDWSSCQRQYAEDGGGGMAGKPFLSVVYE